MSTDKPKLSNIPNVSAANRKKLGLTGPPSNQVGSQAKIDTHNNNRRRGLFNWDKEKEYVENLIFDKGGEFYLVVRKPYWFVMSTKQSSFESEVKAWEDHFWCLYGIMCHILNDKARGNYNLANMPNLTSLAIDQLQGRHFEQFSFDAHKHSGKPG